MSRRKQQQRREFLRRAAAYSVLGSSLSAMGGKLGLISTALAQSSDYSHLTDYKSLVCIFLYGGSDSFNMFVPADAGGFQAYQNSRGPLALELEDTTADSLGTDVRFNNELTRVREIYNAGDLAVVRNVGNLITPTSRLDVLNEAPNVPSELFAHNHQQEQWLKGLSSLPRSVTTSGWGGRMADLLQSANTESELAPAFNLSGSNFWSPGANTTPLSLDPVTGLDLLSWHDVQAGPWNNQRSELMEQMLALYACTPGTPLPNDPPCTVNHQRDVNLLEEQSRLAMLRARSGSRTVARRLQQDLLTTSFTADNPLSAQLRMVAQLIAHRENLNMHRQIFFVSLGGWDTHDNQAPRLTTLLQTLDQALGEFHTAMGPDGLNVNDSVTAFTASDFGRTLTINGDGSDHGWGGHYLAMGGAVAGGELHGEWPDFEIGGNRDAGDKGRVIPDYSINQYGASMARWMGVSESNLLDTVFPDLNNFSTPLDLFLPV